MKNNDPATFHKLYGAKKPRAVYYKKDFVDYALMIMLSALVTVSCYGVGRAITIVSLVLSAFMLFTFVVRHGVECRIPLILRRPQDILYMLIYKLENLSPIYFIALALLILENLLIAVTPGLPHHWELMRRIGLYLFYIHFVVITAYRTVILVDHLAKKELVREVLMQTPWQRVIRKNTNMTLEILHAYGTGVLSHIMLLAPWYLVIRYCKFSVIFLPIIAAANIILQLRWFRAFPAWFYRDHWLGHNSELDFIFLHGTHHDAIPSGLIAVVENGLIEGFVRFALASPVPFYDPIIAFMVCMFDIKNDIDRHQYIPGIFPKLPRQLMEVFQHSTHHYGPIEPYSIGAKLDQPSVSEDYKRSLAWIPDEIMNSIKLDEELTGFQWDNPTYRRILSLYDKYHS